MGYSKEHVQKVRQTILDRAGQAFRTHGFQGASIDAIMKDAGLTRGGFYAHFKSKKDLFVAVAAEDFDFTNQINKLADLPDGAIEDRVMLAVSHYLDAEKSEKIANACTMATLSSEISRRPEATDGFAQGFDSLVEAIGALLARDGGAVARDCVEGLIATCVGALTLARAMPKSEAQRVLAAAQRIVAQMLTAARAAG